MNAQSHQAIAHRSDLLARHLGIGIDDHDVSVPQFVPIEVPGDSGGKGNRMNGDDEIPAPHQFPVSLKPGFEPVGVIKLPRPVIPHIAPLDEIEDDDPLVPVKPARRRSDAAPRTY